MDDIRERLYEALKVKLLRDINCTVDCAEGVSISDSTVKLFNFIKEMDEYGLLHLRDECPFSEQKKGVKRLSERGVCILIALAGAVVQIIMSVAIGRAEGKKAARDAFRKWRGGGS